MDPMTIATGVLTFMGTCNALVTTIKKLHHLRNAPRELEELTKEILALRSCMEGINQLVQTQSGSQHKAIGQISLSVYIESARKKTEQIQHFLEQSLLNTASTAKIRPRAWLKWQSEFARLRQELRDVRSEIGTCISLFNA